MQEQTPKSFYEGEISKYQNELKQVKTRLVRFAILRLISFIGAILLMYYTFSLTAWPIIIGIVGFASFLFLVSQYADLKLYKKHVEYLIEINQNELRWLAGEPVEGESGAQFLSPTHAFASDVDLFGEQSFYQLINRTELKEGEAFLAELLAGNDINNIEDKQEAVKELAGLAEWRHQYKATAGFVESEISRPVIVNWLNNYKPFMGKSIRYLAIGMSVLSVLILTAYIFGYLPIAGLLIPFAIGLVITGRYVKRINKLSIHVGELKRSFSSYSRLIEQLESMEFESSLCREKQSAIRGEQETASLVLKTFSKHLSALDQRNNILFAVFGNAFLLWDCHQTLKIEEWIKTNHLLVESWFKTIEFFDAYNSLGTYAFNRPDYTYPAIDVKSQQVIKAEALGHIMIDSGKRVDNNFEIDSSAYRIITGANMAGKSTFLRTVSLAIISANTGLPVCAKQMIYKPIRLVTSMRNTDSLMDDSSYFFSELVRLKYIVDLIKNEPYFIILDEILKGTNSKDKEEGSKKLMKKLAKTNSSGIIATHDLGLCDITKDLVNVQNQYFDAEIINDELSFDYTLKPGICQNMNASFLLKKMEIV